MDVVVIFSKVSLKDIKGSMQLLEQKIVRSASMLKQQGDTEPVKVRMVEGVLPNSLEATKIMVFVSSHQVVNNLGKAIVDFKNDIINCFREHEIVLDRRELEVKMNSPFDIDRFLKGLDKGASQNTSSGASNTASGKSDEFDYEAKSKQYEPVEPLYSFDRVILPKDIIDKIQEAVGILECENKVFKEWGLYEIQPHPSTALSFFGPSGTGKTMAAEAVAQKLGKKILKVSYADVESKYHGEGPKMVKAIFLAATNADAVLFFDEADSLLSKRLTSVTQGSEQAINSMRSQLLICLEEFRGIVIFATNLVVNYDQAFLTRLISVEFTMPDVDTRRNIWDVHIRASDDGAQHQLKIPLAEDVNTQELAEKYEFVGREIRNAVVSACVSVALDNRDIVTQKDFVAACEKIVAEQKSLAEAKDHTQSLKDGNALLKEAIMNKIKKNEEDKINVSQQSE